MDAQHTNYDVFMVIVHLDHGFLNAMRPPVTFMTKRHFV